MKLKTKFAAIVLLVVGFYLEGSSAAAPAPALHKKVDDESLTATEVARLYARKAAAPYEGKIISVRGVAGDHGVLAGQHPYVTLEVSKDGKLVAIVMCFLDRAKSHLSPPTKGSQARYSGVLKGIVGRVITMEECQAVLSATTREVSTEAISNKAAEEEARAFLESLPNARFGFVDLTNPHFIAMGGKPEEAAIYDLQFMKAVQKVPGGYFLKWTLYGMDQGKGAIFLRTDLELREDALFTAEGYWAVYAGPFSFQNIRGFESTIHGFDLLTPKPTSQPRDLKAVDLNVVYRLMRRNVTETTKPPPPLDATKDYTPLEVYDYVAEFSRSKGNQAFLLIERKHMDALSRLQVADLVSRGYAAYRAEEVCADLAHGNFKALSEVIGAELRVSP